MWTVDAERRTVVRLSLRTLQLRNAVGDALRHESAPRRKLKTGRRASRTACDAERRTIVGVIVAHDLAWECSA
ncbi:DUF1534 domain-containing protein [Pseudomonas avellanae]|uniref:DUF1534 domain-containing protein n=1 Tax=Pseudomonas avellanae TaxID=46257 RepID=A0AAD0M5U6_9PSED|nr:DUF1534 domain-containing protein [Pseudomonas avellanae]POP88009.1 DUF1534 domain-containing protein [Pseudomonas amygdali pv. morsprunorum]